MEVNGLLSRQGENLFNKGLGGPQSQSGYFTEEKKQLLLLGNKCSSCTTKSECPRQLVNVFKGPCKGLKKKKK
jgi:hypothetical protein